MRICPPTTTEGPFPVQKPPPRQLTKLTLLFPARRCQIRQFSIFLGQLELSVAEAGSAGQAVLRQASVRHQQHLPTDLKLLKLHNSHNEQRPRRTGLTGQILVFVFFPRKFAVRFYLQTQNSKSSLKEL